MTDIVERLRHTLLDRDNFPRMDSEKWLPVGLAKEAADEIERLRADLTQRDRELALILLQLEQAWIRHDRHR